MTKYQSKLVKFWGYDDQVRTAFVESVRRGIAKLRYQVRGETVHAYLDRKAFTQRVQSI